VLYYMHDNLVEEFVACSMVKDMRDKLKIRFGQTSEARLHTLQLKWMQYKMYFIRTMAENLRTMSAMICDLKPLLRKYLRGSKS